MQSDGNRPVENWHFLRGYNFWTNDPILIFKTPTCTMSVFVSGKSYLLIRTCLNLLFISCRLMEKVHFQTVPIWLLHTVCTSTTYVNHIILPSRKLFYNLKNQIDSFFKIHYITFKVWSNQIETVWTRTLFISLHKPTCRIFQN